MSNRDKFIEAVWSELEGYHEFNLDSVSFDNNDGVVVAVTLKRLCPGAYHAFLGTDSIIYSLALEHGIELTGDTRMIIF